MKKKILFGFAFFLLSSLKVHAQALYSENLLSRDIMVSAKTLKTEKKIYNYFYLQQVWSELRTEAGRQSFVNRYLSERAGSFWDLDFTDASTKNYAAGAGLYFAIDPLISKTYGNSFVELTMPAGTRFINVVSPIAIKKDTMAAMLAEGLFTSEQVAELFPKSSGFYRDTLRAMVQPQYTNFRRMVQRIFTTNNIQFVEYNFNSSLGGFCRKHSYSAFVFVGQHNLTNEKRGIVVGAFQNISLMSTQLDLPNLSVAETDKQSAIVKFRSVLEELPNKGGHSAARAYILQQYTESEYAALKDWAYSCE